MKKYVDILKNTLLFQGVSAEEIEAMTHCLQVKSAHFSKGQYVVQEGEIIHDIMIVIEGYIHIQKDDFWGNRSIINVIGPGDMFGEAYAASHSNPILNDVVAVKDTTVLYFNMNRVLTACSSVCTFHTLVLHNLFRAISEKNKILVQKLCHISQRSTREKLLSYLSEEAKRHGKSSFTIPLNRQELADYLSVDRSAMSNELSKLRKEGLLDYKKNLFILFSPI